MIEKINKFKCSDGKLFEDELLAYKHECEYLQGIVSKYLQGIIDTCNERTEFYTSEGIKIDYISKYTISTIKSMKLKDKKRLSGQGFYMWFDIKNQKGYIGSSKDLYKRAKQFLCHSSSYAGPKICEARQYEYNFVFFVLQECDFDNIDNRWRLEVEDYYMDKYNTIQNGYNCCHNTFHKTLDEVREMLLNEKKG